VLLASVEPSWPADGYEGLATSLGIPARTRVDSRAIVTGAQSESDRVAHAGRYIRFSAALAEKVVTRLDWCASAIRRRCSTKDPRLKVRRWSTLR